MLLGETELQTINALSTSVNSLSTSVITFAKRLDPHKARQNVRPDLDPTCLTLR